MPLDPDKITMGDLIDERRRGEEDLYKQFDAKMRVSVYRRMKRENFDSNTADDIAAIALVHFSRQLDSGFGKPSFKASDFFWRYSVRKAKNLQLKDSLKQRKAKCEIGSLDELQEEWGDAPQTGALKTDFRADLEQKRILEHCFSKFSPKIRTALVLYYIEQQTQAEIARQLKTNQGTVSRWLSKEVVELRNCLEENGYLE